MASNIAVIEVDDVGVRGVQGPPGISGTMPGRVTPFQFGGKGDGVADDTAAVNAAIDYCYATWSGGEVDMSGGRWLIDGGDILLKAGVTLRGTWRNAGQLADAVDHPVAVLWTFEKSSLVLNPAYTVRFVGDCAGLEGMMLIRKGLYYAAVSTDVATRLAIVRSFAGTAVTIGSVSGPALAGEAYVGYCFIVGFNKAIYNEYSGRSHIEYVSGDNTNGIHVTQSLDMQHISHCHFWPYAAGGVGTSYAVSGAVNNGSGLIRLTLPTHILETGDYVTVFSVGGTVEANDKSWKVTKVDSTHIDLQGSTFANAYTSGGTVYVYPGARSGTAYLFDVRTDWAQAQDCFCFGYERGFDIFQSSHAQLVNCSVDHYGVSQPRSAIAFSVRDCVSPILIGPRAAAVGTGVLVDVGVGEAAVVTHANCWSNDITGVYVKSGYATITNSLIQDVTAIIVDPNCDGVTVTGNKGLGGITAGMSISGAALRKSTIMNNAWPDTTVGERQVIPTSNARSRYLTNFSSISTGPTQVYQKGRGTTAAPAAVAVNDASLSLSGQFWDGVDQFRTGGTYTIIAAEVTSATAAGAKHVFNATLAGSLTGVNALTISGSDVVLGVDIRPAGNGVQALGSNASRWANTVSNLFTMPNNITNPAAITNHGQLYLDGTNLKFKFPSGTIKTIATDP